MSCEITFAQERPGFDVPSLELVGDVTFVKAVACGGQFFFARAVRVALGLDTFAPGDGQIRGELLIPVAPGNEFGAVIERSFSISFSAGVTASSNDLVP